jgi:predicted DNA-binding protein
MSKTINICLEDEKYELFNKFAKMDNRDLANFIETATSRYIEEIKYIDEFEMAEINANEDLQKSLQQGRLDIKNKRRRLVSEL